MNLDEAIKHCEEVIVENLEKTKDRNASDPIAINCFKCADEHRQLTEWLKDYKRLLEQQSCEDCISRQAVFDAFHYWFASGFEEDRWWNSTHVLAAIEGLPPVTPQPKTGHWEYVQYDYNPKLGNWHCSECRCVVVECVNKEKKGGIPLYRYCPQCGARMFEPQESDHKSHNCKHYVSGQRDGSCGSYICKNYSGWESEE